MTDLTDWIPAALVAIPSAAGLIAALPGTWWSDERRGEIVGGGVLLTAACAVGLLLLTDADSVRRKSAEPSPGWTWLKAEGALPEVRVTFRRDAPSLALAAVGAGASFVALATLCGRRSRATAALIGALAASQSAAILSTNLLIGWAGWIVGGVALAGIGALEARALVDVAKKRDPGEPSGSGVDGNDVASAEGVVSAFSRVRWAEAAVLLALAWWGMKSGTLEPVPWAVSSNSVTLTTETSHEASSITSSARDRAASFAGIAMLLAICARLGLFPWLPSAAESRVDVGAAGVLRAASSLPAATALLWHGRMLAAESATLQSIAFSLGVAMILFGSWSAAARAPLAASRGLLSAPFGLFLVGWSTPALAGSEATFEMAIWLSGGAALLPAVVRSVGSIRGGKALVAGLLLLSLSGLSGTHQVLAGTLGRGFAEGRLFAIATLAVSQIAFGLACVRLLQRTSSQGAESTSSHGSLPAWIGLAVVALLAVAPALLSAFSPETIERLRNRMDLAAVTAPLPWMLTVWPGVLGGVFGLVFPAGSAESSEANAGRIRRLVSAAKDGFHVTVAVDRLFAALQHLVGEVVRFVERTVIRLAVVRAPASCVRRLGALHDEIEASSVSLTAAILALAMLALGVFFHFS